MEYREKMLDLANLLLEIIARGLPYAQDIFDDFKIDPVANVRLLHYPPQTIKGENQLGGKCLYYI